MTDLTRAQVEQIRQTVIEDIGDFDRPADEIRDPRVAILRDMVNTDASLRARLEEALKVIHRMMGSETVSDEARKHCWLISKPEALTPAAEPSIDTKRFEQAPCYLCGYNGELYYQPSTHSCAKLYHEAIAVPHE